MKKFDFIFNLIICAGIFMILGTAGGSDNNLITLSEIVTFTLSGVALISVGNAGKKIVHALMTPPKKPAVIKQFPRYKNDFAA